MKTFSCFSIAILISLLCVATANAKECHSCSSEENLECATRPILNATKECSGQCVTAIFGDNNVTLRGCAEDVNGTVENIETCDGELCNDQIFPAYRFLCHQCSGDKCINEPGEALACPYYTKGDLCYYAVDKTRGVFVRGCLSDSNNVCKDDDCTKCLGNGCNKEKPKTKQVICFSCDSTQDKNCATTGNDGNCTIGDVGTCTYETTENGVALCYTYERNETVTRGCSKDLQNNLTGEEGFHQCEGDKCNNACLENRTVSCVVCDTRSNPECRVNPYKFESVCPPGTDSCYLCKDEFGHVARGCGRSENDNCTICKDNSCNNSPVQIECFACNSTENVKCSEWPKDDNVPTEVCRETQDTCVWLIEYGVTLRGCKSNFENFTLEEGSSGECDTPQCNKGVVAPTRLACYQCQGSSCVNATGKPQACKNVKADDKCFTDVVDETNVTRGCMSDTINCQSRFCRTCEGPGCNKNPAVTTFSCASCRSFDTNDCVRVNSTSETCTVNNEVFCYHHTFYGHPEKCFTYHDLDIVIRGCSKDIPKKLINNKNLVECFEDNCNNECIKNVKCAVCDSRTDPKCKNDVNSLTLQECPLHISSCHTCTDNNGTVIRGCGSGLENNLQCNFCQGTGCNNDRKPITCYTCDSRYDPNCAKWEYEPKTEECPHPDDECIWRIAGEYTMRGCSSKVRDCNKNEGECGSCREDKCNAGIKPDNRLLCHQCDGTGCVEQIGKPAACEYYRQDDKCFTGIVDEHNVVRGCMSDKIDRCLTLDKCYICSKGGCNRSPFVVPISMKKV